MKMNRDRLNNLTMNITDGEHCSVIDEVNGKYFLLSNKNIVDGQIKFNDMDRKISKISFDKIRKRTKLNEEDLVISTVGSIGKIAIIKSKSLNYDFQRSVGIIKCDKNKILPSYLYYYLNQNLVQKRLNYLSKGAVQKCLFISDLQKLIIDFPEKIEEQNLISMVLKNLDAKIEINNKINLELEALAKMIYDYWFVQFDFPNEKGKPYKTKGGKMVWNERLKKKIPIKWEVKNSEYFGDFKNGINYNPNIKEITLAKIINVRNISSTNWFVSQYDLDSIKLNKADIQNYILTQKDILIARSGIPGATRLMCEFDTNTIYCGFIIRYRIKEEIYKNYLFLCLKDLEKSNTARSGGTIMSNVNQETLKRIIFALPDDKLISKFNSVIAPIFKSINHNLNENQQLKELRDWLLPMLMNGQVKVT